MDRVVQAAVGVASEFYSLSWGTPSLPVTLTVSENQGRRGGRDKEDWKPRAWSSRSRRAAVEAQSPIFSPLREFQNQPLVRILNGISSLFCAHWYKCWVTTEVNWGDRFAPLGLQTLLLYLAALISRHCYLNGTHFQTGEGFRHSNAGSEAIEAFVCSWETASILDAFSRMSQTIM